MGRFCRKFTLNRANVQKQLLHNTQLLDNVQEQVEGMAEVHPSIKVWRNDDRDRGSVVATIPMEVEDAHRGLLLDNVQEQVEGMAEVHPSIKVWRNDDRDRGSVVATIPMEVEDAHRGLMSEILGKVRI